MLKKIFFGSFFSIIILIFSISTIGAQTSITDLGFTVSVNNTNAQSGDILCANANGYELCKNEYDSSIYGVINDNPSLVITVGNLQNPHTVISRGEVEVRVSSKNGNIKKGDFITTSKTAGVGELSTKSGYVLGTALSDYSSNDPNAVSQIPVAINIHARVDIIANTKENLIDLLRNGLSGLGVSPISALRYLVASSMVVLSFVIGFIYFGRIAKSGVEAIGRNPLAGIRIQVSVLINVLVMLAIIAAGLVTAYLILAL